MTISLLSKKSVFLLATVATFSQQVMAVTAPLYTQISLNHLRYYPRAIAAV
ncbi:hypothetical protein [Photobacterium sanguinicancri]|uniref:hypothetical protein n=1 Tax=Photobacterium sanguinicancri TaxID=875932 RepID=UPI000B090505|nr:hypothetical protein [Photobacterium sanguinicancri]